MPLLHTHFHSNVLNLAVSTDAIIPEPDSENPRQDYPVLYLLHGLSDDHTIWQRRTSIERYIAEMDLAVVMPGVDRSWYTDMARGPKYWTYISEELPTIARHLFPLSDRPQDTFVAGLSMGGYGAFKLALTYPDRYAAAASLSGALDVAVLADEVEQADAEELTSIFGDLQTIRGGPNDLFALAEKAARSAPPLFQFCGTEDFLYEQNLRFRDHAQNLGLDLTYHEAPGEHDWGLWDTWIQHVLDWLPIG